MIENIEDEARYHTIVVMRTREVSLATKFPHTIFSKKDDISYTAEKQEKNYDYNVEIDAFKVDFNHRKIILGNFMKIASVFGFDRWKKQKKNRVIEVKQLKQFKSLEFFLYLQNQEFAQIAPLAIINNTIVFLYLDFSITPFVDHQSFKDSYTTQPEDTLASQQVYFHYSSEFGLLSDLHFLNNVVRGQLEFSCYRKLQSHYLHLIDFRIMHQLNKLFGTAKF